MTALPFWRCIPAWIVVVPVFIAWALVKLPFDSGRSPASLDRSDF